MTTNRERADSVSGFVAEFAADGYWGGEHVEIIVADMICNLLHFVNIHDAAGLSECATFDDEPWTADAIIQLALGGFEYESAFPPDEETD